ncbi:DUF1850 domain-containing protein [Psychrobacillus soli]|uniref:DUF1850 domain-containing protein n=1 Tax=Psychrobacillus soli TaxID=1543965 RepID=A0A544T661_9BACI|nr:DUF1850 domain-containing protein [Psychrobacillus soli]TQR12936.1 DUF1850 domain-containing protein [Psychrobacillus soli]
MRFLQRLVIFSIICGLVLLIFYPTQLAFVFTETRTAHPTVHYIPVQEDRTFQIRYTHSIHKSDVIESYKIRNNASIQLLTMEYTDLAIGLPGYAEEGQLFEELDGKYMLTYKSEVIDTFTIFIANIDMDLAFRYGGEELDLKKTLNRGKSYEVNVKKLSRYQQMKGEKMHEGKKYNYSK